MSKHLTVFWENFQSKNFTEAQEQLDALSPGDKQAVLAELFQKSEFHRKPFMISLLRGKLQDGKSFSDFYEAWLPQDLCKPVQINGQTYQQGFPTPVRVMNAVNTKDPNDIVSIGITWVANKDDEKKFWDYMNKASKGEDETNEIRHDRIKQVAERELLGLFSIETDDNLGMPF